MSNTKNLFEIIYKFISKMNEQTLEKIINGEYKLTYIKLDKLKESNDNNVKVNVVYEKIRTAKTREDAKSILIDSKLTKDNLLILGKYLDIKIPKSNTKAKIIDKLVEIYVGGKIDKESIVNIKLK
ncbi:MAG: hypothetical protein E6X43_14090 [Peptostreptococcaceae bacterium]|nr:hypothetical protein [Peptostreptococcaceae bacterium]